MNSQVLPPGRSLRKEGLGWGWEPQTACLIMTPTQALAPLGALHTDPAARGHTLAWNP